MFVHPLVGRPGRVEHRLKEEIWTPSTFFGNLFDERFLCLFFCLFLAFLPCPNSPIVSLHLCFLVCSFLPSPHALLDGDAGVGGRANLPSRRISPAVTPTSTPFRRFPSPSGTLLLMLLSFNRRETSLFSSHNNLFFF